MPNKLSDTVVRDILLKQTGSQGMPEAVEGLVSINAASLLEAAKPLGVTVGISILNTFQIWKYSPSPYEGTEREGEAAGKLELFVEPNDPRVMDHPDQLTVPSFGEVFVCEDGDDEQYVLGITPERQIYKFARNALNRTELSGVVFSPDESTMFVNILASGLTFAITGPWI